MVPQEGDVVRSGRSRRLVSDAAPRLTLEPQSTAHTQVGTGCLSPESNKAALETEQAPSSRGIGASGSH